MPLNRITLVVQPIPKVWIFRFLAISTPFPHHLPWRFKAGSHCTIFMTGSCRHRNRREAPSCRTRICSCPTAWQKKKNPGSECKTGGVVQTQDDTPRMHQNPSSIVFFLVACFTVNTQEQISRRFTCGYQKTAGSRKLLRITLNLRTCPNERDSAREQPCYRCCWEAQRMLIWCKKSLSQNA